VRERQKSSVGGLEEDDSFWVLGEVSRGKSGLSWEVAAGFCAALSAFSMI
jgi:hypothetical protein